VDPARLDQSARYVLGANDQLKITVFDEPDLSKRVPRGFGRLHHVPDDQQGRGLGSDGR